MFEMLAFKWFRLWLFDKNPTIIIIKETIKITKVQFFIFESNKL